MMRCPVCGHTSHTRTNRYISLTIKEAYYQCQDIGCSCTFKTIESVDRIICQPKPGKVAGKTDSEDT